MIQFQNRNFMPAQSREIAFIILLLLTTANLTFAQNTPDPVIISGARFAYPLLQKWIDDYNKVNPDAQIIIEARGTSDPKHVDILADVYEPTEEAKKDRDYIPIARYGIVPVAVANSPFAKIYGEQGLTQALIRQLFFTNLIADIQKDQEIKAPYNIYTRLQRAGVPIVFTTYFGFEQKDIKGKAIAGSDEHLLKAFLRDSNGVTYLPLPLAYDLTTRKPHAGLVVLPVDLSNNGKISPDEKFYDNLSSVIERLEKEDPKDIHNLPVGTLHLSIPKKGAPAQAIAFLKWVVANSNGDLHNFGYMNTESLPTNKILNTY